MSRQVNLGQIIPNIQVGETITGNAGTQANVENTGTNLNPILNFTIPKGATGSAGKDGKDGADAKINGVNALNIEAGDNITLDQVGSTLTINSTGGGSSDYTDLTNKPKINNVELNGNKTSSDLGLITNAVDDLVNYYKKSETFTKQEVNDLIAAITTMDIQVVQTLPTEDISTTTIYLVPKTTAETNDAYDEYIYVSNAWEHIGSTEVDLTNYVTNTDYATSSVGGVLKVSDGDYGITVDNGVLKGTVRNYTQYSDMSSKGLVAKGTLENVITGKSLVSSSDLATVSTTGSYDDLSDTPTNVSEFTNDAGYLTTHQDISGKLDVAKFYNDYYFSMPKTIYAKLNTEMKFYYNNITTANYLLKWGQYTNSTTIRDNDDYISVLPTAKATKSIGYSVFDRYLNNIEDGTTSFVINDTAPNSQTMLILGDSFISQNYIGPDLRNLFNEDGKTLTLIGTKGTAPNKNEGYAGWKYTDFVSGNKASTTPFWDGSKFNFSYYMQQQGFSTLDSVYIQLGTNDCSATSPNQNFTDTLNAANTIINSILSYDANIKIYLGLTVMPTLNTSKFAEKYNGIGFNWIMRANMQKLNKAIIDTFSNNNAIKIVSNNLILDSTTDINDNVHPNSTGYQKIANQVYYTMMS